MQVKSITSNQISQEIPAGVSINDNNIEFVGNQSTKTVVWIQNGRTNLFSELPENIFNALKELYRTDKEAQMLLPKFHPKTASCYKKQVEVYTYYMFGQLDSTPDVVNGKLQQSENLRDTKDCISLNFKNKNIVLNGVELSPRHLQMLDEMAAGLPDKAIAKNMHISQSTLDFHKRNLFKSIKVNSKIDAVVAAFKNKILCEI